MEKIKELQELIMQEMDLSREVEDKELREVICRVLKEKSEENYLSLQERATMGKELFNSFRKLDILQELLEDDEITEIMINGTDCIFIEKRGGLYQLDKRFEDRKKLEDVAQQIVAGANRMVNEASPIVDARLPDGSRVNIVLYPVALNGPVITIRKFAKEGMDMAELIRRNSVNEEICRFLKMLVESGYNIFISGGTGSG